MKWILIITTIINSHVTQLTEGYDNEKQCLADLAYLLEYARTDPSYKNALVFGECIEQ